MQSDCMAHEPDRRRYPRIPINMLIQYRFDTFEAFVVEYIQDISEGGILIRDPEIVRPLGSTVHLQFVLRDGTRLIEGLSRVVRIQEEPNRAMALEFIDFDDASKALIRRLTMEPSEALPTEDMAYHAG